MCSKFFIEKQLVWSSVLHLDIFFLSSIIINVLADLFFFFFSWWQFDWYWYKIAGLSAWAPTLWSFFPIFFGGCLKFGSIDRSIVSFQLVDPFFFLTSSFSFYFSIFFYFPIVFLLIILRLTCSGLGLVFSPMLNCFAMMDSCFLQFHINIKISLTFLMSKMEKLWYDRNHYWKMYSL